MLAAALLALAAVGQAFAGYVGPDNVTYDYKIVNWFVKMADDPKVMSYDANDQWWSTSVNTEHDEVTGVITYGPSGIEDYSVNKSRKVITRNTTATREIYGWRYDQWGYSPEEAWVYASEYSSNSDYPNDDFDDPGFIDESGPGYLGVDPPSDASVIAVGTVYYGVDSVFVVTPVPDPITPGMEYTSYVDPEISGDYLRITPMAGVQIWATITWTNSTPLPLDPPEVADFED